MLIHSEKTVCKKESGFTLMEILIAVLVLSIGLLGLAALQITGLKNNQSSQYRSMATILAYDMADRIRVNVTASDNNEYSIGMGDAPAAGATNCQGAECNTSAMAIYDMAYWKCSLGLWNNNAKCTGLAIQGDLPLGDGSIAKNNNGVYTITIQWDDARTGNADQSFTMDFIP